MAAAAQIVEGMGADIVDVNMGCPVPKIAKHNAGCSLMREPAHAASVIAAMAHAVKIPVTVKMRAGWNDDERNAPDAGADGRGCRRGGGGGARTDGGAELQRVGRLGHRRADRRCTHDSGVRQRRLRRAGAGDRAHGAGVEGVLVGRGVLRNPWILAQARRSRPRAGRRGVVTMADRGQFLLDYIELLSERERSPTSRRRRRSHDRWIVNKLRALGSWYTKGLDNGSHLRTAINTADSLPSLCDVIAGFFFAPPAEAPAPAPVSFARSMSAS